MLEMLTEEEDVVIDLFGGTGNMAREATQKNRHCICVERDEELYTNFLAVMEGDHHLC